MSALKHYLKLLTSMREAPKEIRVSRTDYALLYKEMRFGGNHVLIQGWAGKYPILMLRGTKIIEDSFYELTSNGASLGTHWEKLSQKDKNRLLTAFEDAYDKPANLHMATLPFVTCLQAYRALMFHPMKHAKLLDNLRAWGEITSIKEQKDGHA